MGALLRLAPATAKSLRPAAQGSGGSSKSINGAPCAIITAESTSPDAGSGCQAALLMHARTINP